ncbi:MAG: hypothetical protein SCM57_08350, partial [Bacillota bacterium]|nr:hypothetical protein [Bacillota bacterium]
MLDVPADSIREELSKKSRTSPGRSRLQPAARPQAGQSKSAAQKAPLQILALWARFPALISSSAGNLEEDDFPAELHSVFAAAQKDGNNFSPPHLLDLLTDEKDRQAISRLLIHEDYEEKIAKKAVDDCIRLLKSVRIARRRKELEAQMAKLDPDASKGEFGKLSKEWHELRKMEEEINYPREGGKGVG